MWKLLFPGEFPRYVIIAIWLALSLGATLWLAIGASVYWGVQDRAADWAQALGGMLGVAAAIYAVTDQRRSERRASEARDALVVKSLRITAQRAYEAVLKLHFEQLDSEAELDDLPRPGMVESANNALAAIRSMAPLNMPEVRFIDPVITLTRCLESVLMIYEGKQANDGGRSGQLVDLARFARDSIMCEG